MSKITPTQRTLAILTKDGWEVGIVERWIQRAFVRQDLFGIIDMIAIRPGQIVGVQATSDNGGNVSAHIIKAKAEPRLKTWLEAGGEFWVVGWGKKGPRGKRKVWTMRTIKITLEDLSED